jgi:hypothetical protein
MTTRTDLARNNTKIDKLIRMREELSTGKSFSITRLTALKSIIKDKAHAEAFALYISQKTKSRIRNIKPKYVENWAEDKKLIDLAAIAVRKYLSKPRQARSHELTSLLRNLERIQEWGKNPYWAGPLRIIADNKEQICVDT